MKRAALFVALLVLAWLVWDTGAETCGWRRPAVDLDFLGA